MLNLGEQIKKFGPIRWYWEGTHERFIQTVKVVLVSLRKSTSYMMRKLELIQKLNVLKWLNDDLKKDLEEGGRKKRKKLSEKLVSVRQRG